MSASELQKWLNKNRRVVSHKNVMDQIKGEIQNKTAQFKIWRKNRNKNTERFYKLLDSCLDPFRENRSIVYGYPYVGNITEISIYANITVRVKNDNYDTVLDFNLET